MSQSYQHAITFSLVIHFAIAGILLFGDFSSTPPKPTPMAVPIQTIQAVAVDRKVIEEQINKIKREEAAKQKRIRDAKRKKEQERLKKIADKKRKEAEKKARALAAEKARKEKIKKEKERKKAEEKAKKLKAEREKKRKAEEARKKKEAEQKRKAAEQKRKAKEAKERAAQEKLLQQQMAEEMASRQQARRQQVMTEIGKYTALIRQTIQRNLITDQATMEGKSCKLTISLAPSGFVTNVVPGQGDRVVCDAAKTAIYKAGTLPVSKDPEVFKEMRTISLTVVPEF